MRLAPILLVLAWSLVPITKVTSVATEPLRHTSVDFGCNHPRLNLEDREAAEEGSRRLASSEDACAVAGNNLARDEAEILKAKRSMAASPSKAWDRRTRPQFFDLVRRRFELQPEELAMIDRIGFAVLARLEVPTYSRGYHEIFQSQLPVYITADSIFHAIFASHDAVVEKLERFRLSPMLAQALNDMHCALAAAAPAYPSDVVRDLDLYLLVARRLLSEADQPHSVFADKTVEEETNELVAKVMAANEVAKVTLFGRLRLVDFTQYGPRGHYAAEEAMQKYFRAAMWASRLEFNLLSRSSRSSAPGPDPDPSETPREAIAALALADLAVRSGAAKYIGDLDVAWKMLGGRREDVSIAQLAELRTQVGSLLSPSAFEKLKSAIGDRFRRTTRLHPMPEGSRDLPAIATLIGSRIVADADAIMPLVNGAVPGRHHLGITDIAYIFGHDRAKTYLSKDLAAFPALDGQLGVARAQAASTLSGDDLYSAWLAAIQAVARPAEGTLPSFLAGEIGKDLRLNTIAGAYGQLKHNSVLVAGQPYAEFGCEIPDGYVEPVPAAYDALIEYAARGAKLAALLDARNGLGVQAHFERVSQVLRVLRTIVEHELEALPLTEPERRWLGMVAELNVDRAVDMTGHPPMYSGWYFDLFFDREKDGMRGADYIADYFTSQNEVAYAGATAPRLGIFVVDAGGPARAFVGPVARAYEAHGPLASRYTDETARTLTEREEPWAKGYSIPAAAPPTSLQLSFDSDARELVLTSDRALGQAKIKVLDHHRMPIETKHATVKQGETRISITNKRVAGVFVEIGGFRDFVVADAYGEIKGQWGEPPVEQ